MKKYFPIIAGFLLAVGAESGIETTGQGLPYDQVVACSAVTARTAMVGFRDQPGHINFVTDILDFRRLSDRTDVSTQIRDPLNDPNRPLCDANVCIRNQGGDIVGIRFTRVVSDRMGRPHEPLILKSFAAPAALQLHNTRQPDSNTRTTVESVTAFGTVGSTQVFRVRIKNDKGSADYEVFLDPWFENPLRAVELRTGWN